MPPTQNEMGRAFEFGVALALSERLPARLLDNGPLALAKSCFDVCPAEEQENITLAAREAAMFLVAHDERLERIGCSIALQSDQMGQQGDVRDVVINNSRLNEDIGISAKNRHWAVKHSRLSEHIDFGHEWFAVHCSQTYLHTVTPIFRELHTRQTRGENWADIVDKKQRYYMPILQAFATEIERLLTNNSPAAPHALLHYLLGRFDFYKVIKENGEVSILSFKTEDTAQWGSRLRLPAEFRALSYKPTSESTIELTFDQGWQISFRIHNASKQVEPSLKFDINIVGLPANMSRNVIPYHV